MFEWDIHAAIRVFDVEYNGVSADFTPVFDDADAVVAGGHHTGEVDGADFKIFGDGDRLRGDRGSEDPGDDDVLVRLQDVRVLRLVVDRADGVGKFGGRQVARLAKVTAGDRGNRFSALGGIDLGAGSARELGFGNRKLGGSGIGAGHMQQSRRLL